jgi:predicted RNase H-like HicB family nuclease
VIAIEVEREDEGGWLADCPDLPGVHASGSTPELAVSALMKLVRKRHPSLVEG